MYVCFMLLLSLFLHFCMYISTYIRFLFLIFNQLIKLYCLFFLSLGWAVVVGNISCSNEKSSTQQYSSSSEKAKTKAHMSLLTELNLAERWEGFTDPNVCVGKPMKLGTFSYLIWFGSATREEETNDEFEHEIISWRLDDVKIKTRKQFNS